MYEADKSRRWLLKRYDFAFCRHPNKSTTVYFTALIIRHFKVMRTYSLRSRSQFAKFPFISEANRFGITMQQNLTQMVGSY